MVKFSLFKAVFIHKIQLKTLQSINAILIKLIMKVLPCKPWSQKGATSHCTCLCLCFSPYRRHTLCSACDRLSVCRAPNPHSAALKTKKTAQIFVSVALEHMNVN